MSLLRRLALVAAGLTPVRVRAGVYPDQLDAVIAAGAFGFCCLQLTVAVNLLIPDEFMRRLMGIQAMVPSGLSLLAMCDELWVYGIENPSEGMRSEIEYAKQHQIPIRDAAELYRNREAETLPIGDALIVLPSHVGHLNGVAAIESTTVRINGEMILDLAIELRRHPGHDITLEADKGADSEVDQ